MDKKGAISITIAFVVCMLLSLTIFYLHLSNKTFKYTNSFGEIQSDQIAVIGSGHKALVYLDQ
ncbi:MAG: hypothetical protein O2779_05730, partial [Nanoarchaeota archaeon]|nr:hypothetical protein [Nanoarchaeota archaeon]